MSGESKYELWNVEISKINKVYLENILIINGDKFELEQDWLLLLHADLTFIPLKKQA